MTNLYFIGELCLYLYWHEVSRYFSSFFFICPEPTEQPTSLSLTLNSLSSFSIISLSSLFIYIISHCMPFSNYRLSQSIWKSLFIIERRAHIEFTKCIPNSHLIYMCLSFRQRNDWDVLWLPSVSTLENPAALQTPRLWRSLVTPCGSVCSIAGRTSHCKLHSTSFHFGVQEEEEWRWSQPLRCHHCVSSIGYFSSPLWTSTASER